MQQNSEARFGGIDEARLVAFYGWRAHNGQKLARLAARPDSADWRILERAGWQFRSRLTRGYCLWAPPAEPPRIVRTATGHIIAIGELDDQLSMFAEARA